ncbi:hypothetical protein C8R45DRAFT_935505 [Mycena sanguinolenta]|nr:hypothetical protein C8R45DRAFT_935505 [Mycena sanguinolenta]
MKDVHRPERNQHTHTESNPAVLFRQNRVRLFLIQIRKSREALSNLEAEESGGPECRVECGKTLSTHPLIRAFYTQARVANPTWLLVVSNTEYWTDRLNGIQAAQENLYPWSRFHRALFRTVGTVVEPETVPSLRVGVITPRSARVVVSRFSCIMACRAESVDAGGNGHRANIKEQTTEGGEELSRARAPGQEERAHALLHRQTTHDMFAWSLVNPRTETAYFTRAVRENGEEVQIGEGGQRGRRGMRGKGRAEIRVLVNLRAWPGL